MADGDVDCDTNGVPAKKIGLVIALCAETFGLKLNCKPSGWTIGRAVTEGGIAAEMQLAYELQNTDCEQHYDY